MQNNDSNIPKVIMGRKEILDPSTGAYIMIEGPIRAGRKRLALREYPDIVLEVRNILKDIPDENEDKQVILEKLPTLSYLEQSVILEELKKTQ